MPQIIVPDSTLLSGGWASFPGILPKHMCVDEGVSSHNSDTDYLRAPSSTTSPTALAFEDPVDPETNNFHYLRVVDRELGDTSAENKTYKLQLRRIDNNALLWDSDWITPASTYTTRSYLLPASVIAGAEGYDNIGVVLRVNSLHSWSTAGGDELRVTAIELEVPDAPLDEEIRLTQFGAEILADAPDPNARLTQFGIEVLGTPVYIRHTQFGIEVLAAAGEPAVRLSQFGLEVLADRGIVDLRLTQFGYEALGDNPLQYMRMSQFGVEVLGRRSASEVIPGADPDIIAKLFLHNWRDPIRIETAFASDVTIAKTGARDARALRDRPARSIEMLLHGLTHQEASELWLNLMTFHKARVLVPLIPDYAKTTAESSGTKVFCDPSRRRFFRGARVVIHYWERHRFPSLVEYAKIADVVGDGIVLEEALVGTFPERSRIYPVIECESHLDETGKALASEKGELRLKFLETVGNQTLPSIIDPFGDLADVATYQGYPILPLRIDWSSEPLVHVQQDGDRYTSGRGVVTELRGDPKIGWTLFMRGRTRAESWDMIRFFESRMGRVRPFWAVAPVDLFELVAIDSTELKVKRFGNQDQIEAFLKHVALVSFGGAVEIRGVDSIAPDTEGGVEVWVLTLDEALSVVPPVSKIRRTTFAHLLVQERDYVTEEWTTTEDCSMFVQVIEAPVEKTVELVNLDLPSAIASAPQNVDGLWIWTDAVRGCIREDDGKLIDPATDGDGTQIIEWKDLRGTPQRFLVAGDVLSSLNWYQPAGDRPVITWIDNAHWKAEDQAPPFDNTDGFTIFLSIRKGNLNLDGTHFLFEREDVIAWYHDHVDIFEGLATGNEGFSYASIVNGDSTGDRTVLALTWSPATYCRVYKDGVLAGEATTQVTDLHEDKRATKVLNLDEIDPVATAYWAGTCVIYKRALDTDELNAIGNRIAASFGTVWSDIA